MGFSIDCSDGSNNLSTILSIFLGLFNLILSFVVLSLIVLSLIISCILLFKTETLAARQAILLIKSVSSKDISLIRKEISLSVKFSNSSNNSSFLSIILSEKSM